MKNLFYTSPKYLQNLKGLESSASEIDGKCTFNKNTLTVAGDSIASQNGGGDFDDVNPDQYAVGSINWFNFLSKHKLQLISNKGIGGERSDHILARIDDILSTNANFYMYIVGKNDVVQLISSSVIITNLTEIFNKTLKTGAKVIATTIIPKKTFVQGEVDRIEEVNNWIRNLGNTNKDIIVCDFFAALVNRSTGVSLANTIRDGVHPSVQGAYLLGKEMNNKISKFLPDISYFNSYNAKTNFQLLTNPYFVSGSGSALTGWTQSVATATLNKVSRSDGRIAAEYTCTSGLNYLFQYVSSGFAAGDILEAIAEIEVDSSAVVDQFQIYIQCKSGSTVLKGKSNLQLATVETIRFPSLGGVSGLLKTPRFAVPTGTDTIIYYIQFNVVGKITIDKCNLRKIN